MGVYHQSLFSPKNTQEVNRTRDATNAIQLTDPIPTERRLQRGFPQAVVVEVKLILRDVAEVLEGLMEPEGSRHQALWDGMRYSMASRAGNGC